MAGHHYRVVDLRSADRLVNVVARSPEDAIRKTLGLAVIRSGKDCNLVAKVYWETPTSPTSMVRFYLSPGSETGTRFLR